VADLLNLGAGNRLMVAKAGDRVVNHDRTAHRPEIDVAHDLNELPWPWGDDSFDHINASAVLEHLRLNLVESLNECWRILRPKGRLRLKVPYWRADSSWSDPTHYWMFNLSAFDQFDPDTKRGRDYGFYTDRKWRIVKPAWLNPEKTSVLVLLEVRK
jgi:SAM-dependent methyltransferase